MSGSKRSSFSALEETQLRRLVYQAWELKEAGSPYFLDACRALVEFYERTLPDRLERLTGERG